MERKMAWASQIQWEQSQFCKKSSRQHERLLWLLSVEEVVTDFISKLLYKMVTTSWTYSTQGEM